MSIRTPFASGRLGAAKLVAVLLASAVALVADPEPAALGKHVSAARSAAGSRWEGLFGVLCVEPAQAAPAAAAPASAPGAAAPAPQPSALPSPAVAPPASPAANAPPDRATWYAPPVKVFDNLYYVGMTDYSAWAVTTSAGIILIDTLYDYSVEAEVVEGLRKLGLDPKTIQYAIVSHGHNDHAGGAKYLQDTFGTKIVLGADDWDLLERGNAPKPRRDVVATDGMKLTLGDTTLRLYLTPGHTLGTISSVVPLKDHGRPHVAVTWGGTAFNWVKHPDGYLTSQRPASFWFQRYAASAARFADVAARAHADVLLSNHTIFDGSKQHLPLLSARTAEQPHPYVVGAAAVRDYLTVAKECAQAGLARSVAR